MFPPVPQGLLFSEQFSVQAKANAANVAYTSEYLQLHTDLPYNEYKPGVRTVHTFHFTLIIYKEIKYSI